MDEELIRIGKTRNGFEVSCLDPKIVAENDKPKTSYQSPWVTYTFDKKEQLLEFVEDALDIVQPRRPKPAPSDAFEAAFKEATSDVETDNDQG